MEYLQILHECRISWCSGTMFPSRAGDPGWEIYIFLFLFFITFFFLFNFLWLDFFPDGLCETHILRPLYSSYNWFDNFLEKRLETTCDQPSHPPYPPPPLPQSLRGGGSCTQPLLTSDNKAILTGIILPLQVISFTLESIYRIASNKYPGAYRKSKF